MLLENVQEGAMRMVLAVAVSILSACSGETPSAAPPVSPKHVAVASAMMVGASSISQTAPHQTASQKQEADEIAKSDNLVERNGRMLVLRLQSGKTLELVDSEACENYEGCRVYTYRGLVADKQFYWVLLGYYEGGESLLISRNTGEQVDTIRDPHVSPDGKFIVSASDAEAYEDSGVFLWEIVGGTLVSRFSFVPKDYQLFNFARWVDANNVELVKTAWPPKGECPEGKLAEFSMKLVEKNGKWILEATSDKGKCFQ